MPTIADLAPQPVQFGPAPTERPDTFSIDCDDCAHQHTPTGDDCVVTFLVGREPTDAVVVDADEVRAVRLLERAGLVPGLRHERQVS